MYVLELLRMQGVKCLIGNHEAMLLDRLPLGREADEVYGLRETRRKLGSKDAREISKWPAKAELFIGGRRILFMHGQPSYPLTGYLYPDTDLTQLGNIEADVLVVAHTHHPFLRRVGGLTIVNTGSAGLPRQGGGLTSCAVYDVESDRAWLLWIPLPDRLLSNLYKGKIHHQVLQTLLR